MGNKELDQEEAELKAIRQDEIDALNSQIAAIQGAKADAAAYPEITAAKKEAVGLQLEAANMLRRMEQKHMVDWIISNVKNAITPAQEDAALKKCISDLKKLSAA